MGSSPRASLFAANQTRERARNVKLRSMGVDWERWGKAWSDRFAGMLARGDTSGHAEAARMLDEAAGRLQSDLAGLWQWSWDSATAGLIGSLPMRFWARRLATLGAVQQFEMDWTNARRARILEKERGVLDFDTELQLIVRGELSREDAIAAVRRMLFPVPTPAKVRRILRDTVASDGKTAMDRIVTVAETDKSRLLSILARPFPEDKASYIDAMTGEIEKLVGNVTYKARRIARTEGVRIAEAGQRESWHGVEDLFQGVRTWTAGDSRVRAEHRKWHGKMFLRTSSSGYIAEDGEELPDLPAGPNCRCWSAPELRSDLTDDLPAPDLGAGYRASLARFQRQEA